MIKPLLLLFIALAHTTAFDHKIDLERCSVDMDCFVTRPCILTESAASPNELMKFNQPVTALDESQCDVIVQTKYLNNQKKMLWMIQIKGSDLKKEEGIKINQDAVDQIICKEDDKPGGNGELEFESLVSDFKSDKMLCVLTATVKKDTQAFINIFLNVQNKDAVLLYSTEADGLQTKKFSNKQIFTTGKSDCDSSKAESPLTSTDWSGWAEVDTTKKIIKCQTGDKLKVSYSYTDPSTQQMKNVEELITGDVTCDSNNEYVWTLPTPGKVPDATKFEIGCAKAKFCAACDPLVEYKCPQCTPSSDKDKNGKLYADNGCLIRKCDNTKGKWTIGGKDNVHSPGGVVCKNSGGVSKWFLLDTTAGTEVPSGGASCRDKSTCTTKGSDGKPVTFDCPDTETECAPPLHDTGMNMTCPDGKVLYNNDAVAKSHDCDSATGYWMESGNFYCALSKPEEVSVAPSTGGASSAVVAGGILGALVVIGAIGGAVYFFVLKPRMAAKASKAAGPSKKGGKSSKKSTESKSGANKKPSDSDPPEKAASGKEGAAATPADGATPGGATPGPAPTTDLEKIKTEPSAPKTPAEPAAAVPATPGAPPPPPAAV